MGRRKSPNGINAARTLKDKRRRFRWKDIDYKRRALGLNVKADPLEKQLIKLKHKLWMIMLF